MMKSWIVSMSLGLAVLLTGCAKQKTKIEPVVEVAAVKGPGETKTYSGTYALQAEFNAAESKCGEEDLEGLAAVSDTLKCEQSGQAFRCESLLSNQALVGNIGMSSKGAFQIHNDDKKQAFNYIPTGSLGLGNDAKKRQMLLEGSFINLTTMTQGRLKYIEESSKNIFGGMNTCTLVWNAMLIKAEDGATELAPSAPQISITAEADQETLKISFQSTDADSEDKDIKYLYFHFSGDQALPYVSKNVDAYQVKMDQATLNGLDWSAAHEPEEDRHSVLPMAEGSVLHVVYAIAIDETENKSKVSAVAVMLENKIEKTVLEDKIPPGQDGPSSFEPKPMAMLMQEVQGLYKLVKKSDFPELSTEEKDYSQVKNESEIVVQDKDKAMYKQCFESALCDVWKVKQATPENSFFFAKIKHMKVSPQISEDHEDYAFIVERIEAAGKADLEIKFIVDARDNVWYGDVIPLCECLLYRVIFTNNDYLFIIK